VYATIAQNQPTAGSRKGNRKNRKPTLEERIRDGRKLEKKNPLGESKEDPTRSDKPSSSYAKKDRAKKISFCLL